MGGSGEGHGGRGYRLPAQVARMGTLAGCRAHPSFVGPACTRAAGGAAGWVPAPSGGQTGPPRAVDGAGTPLPATPARAARRHPPFPPLAPGLPSAMVPVACMWQGVTGGHTTALPMIAAAAVVAVVAAAARVLTCPVFEGGLAGGPVGTALGKGRQAASRRRGLAATARVPAAPLWYIASMPWPWD